MELTEFFHFAKETGFLPAVISTSALKKIFLQKRPNTPEMNEVQFGAALDKLIEMANVNTKPMHQLPEQLSKLLATIQR